MAGHGKNITGKDPSEYDALPAGTVLRDRYVIGRLLGHGGFGMTYLAYDKEQDRAVAVKEYYPAGVAVRASDDLTVGPMTGFQAEDFRKGLERFRNESEMIMRFEECSDILGVYDLFRENGTAYYAMEYFGGVSLKNYLENTGRLTEGQAVYAAEKLLPALGAIHAEGVLHRDISPDNIILCRGGGVKLIDFGAAREVTEQSMSVILKEGYAPLEQYQRRGAQSGRTDLYSLAMCLYFGVTGQEPENPIERLDSDRPFEKGLEKLSPALGEVIAGAAAVKERDRYKDAEEMLLAIKSSGIEPETIDVEDTPPPELPLPQKISAWRRFTVAVSAGISDFAAAAGRRFRNTEDITVRIGEEFFPITSTELDLRNRTLTVDRISNLRHMKDLRRLDLSDNYLTGLSCLDGLTELEYIRFDNNRVKDIGFVRSMPRLKEITAVNNEISDISPLAGKKFLAVVNLGDNHVTDISPLADCRELTYVKFDECPLRDTDALAGMEKLDTVSFSGCGLKSAESMRNCRALREAYFGRNDLIDVSPLAGKALEVVYLDNNRRLPGHTGAFSGITVNGVIHVEICGLSREELYDIINRIKGEFVLYSDMDGRIITLNTDRTLLQNS